MFGPVPRAFRVSVWDHACRDQSEQTTNSSSSSSPWAAAQPEVNGLLGKLQTLIPNSGTTPAQQTAIDQLTANGEAGNPYAPAVGSVATNLLNGGGATSQNPALESNLATYRAETNPLASNTNYNPMSTPGFADALTANNTNIENAVNSQFAAAGRSNSGMNAEALAQGLALGDAPTIAAQYNANVANQQNAAQNEYGAGNTTSSAITGNNQLGNTNAEAGIGASNDALTAKNWGPQSVIAAQELGQEIPAQNLGTLVQMGIPLAELGTNTSGTSTTTMTPSLLQALGQLGGAIGTGKSTNAAGVTSGGSGLLGLLGAL